VEYLRSVSRCALLVAVLVLTLTPAKAQSSMPCSDGHWTPEPVQQVESGSAINPTFHAVYGLLCGNTIYMIRMSNVVVSNGKAEIITDVISKALVPCDKGGAWSPHPVQKAQAGGPSDPTFHTVYGLLCGNTIYMIRMSNVVVSNGKSELVTDILGTTSIPCNQLGTWSPEPAQRAELGGPTNPSFHTVYGLSCGDKVLMIRFSNVISVQPVIRVDILAQGTLD
jgi:hypothetical protein